MPDPLLFEQSVSALWRIELLGGFRVAGAERVITRFSTQKTASLLAYLALHLGRSHSRDSLFELLWPECDPEAGRNRLSVALSSLRRQLEPPPVPAGAVILADRHTVRLADATVETDAAEFQRLLDSARVAEPPDVVPKLEQALALYGGELLPGFYDDWIDAERRRMSERASQAMRTLAGHLEARGDRSGALEWKRRAEALEPYEAESATQQHDWPHSGQQRLKVSTIRRTAVPTAASVSRETPRAALRRPQLPLRPNRFFGREEELKWLEQHLSLDASTRLVTLTGPGGGGKSRLSLEAAHRLAPSYSGGAHFVSLAELTCGSRVAEAVLIAVGGRLESGECPVERLDVALGDRPTLVVLDNFEQLVDAGGVEAVQALLEAGPQTRWLVTSRRRLGLQAESVLPVPPLPLPEAPESDASIAIDELLSFDGVRLFVERAQGARPDFQVTPRNAATIAAICRKLEGLPLALELAAARAQVFSPAQMLATLEERLAVRSELLISRQRDRAPRHRTFEAAVGWSFDLLPPPLQAFLAGLSVFHGGWPATAAAAVCDRPDALESLADLGDCSLVRPVAGAGDQRFEMLEMVREFAADRLSDAESETHRERHARWFAGWIESRVQSGAVRGPLSEIEAELANLRAALHWAESKDPHLALRLAATLEPFLHLRGYWAEAKECLERALDRAPEAPAALLAEGLLALGHITVRLGDRDRAAKLTDDAIDLAQREGLVHVEVRALSHALCSTFEENLARLQRSMSLAEQLKDPTLLAGSALAFGNHLIGFRRATEANTLYAQALELFRSIGDPVGEAQALNNLGAVALDRKEWDEARTLLERALELRRESGDTQGLAMTLFNLGSVLDSLDEKDQARRRIAEAQREYEKAADYGGLTLCLRILGDMDYEQGRLRDAASVLRRGLDMAVSRRDPWATATILQGLVPLLTALDKRRAAVRSLGAALHALDGYWERLENRTEGFAEELRSAMGEAAFEEALAEGQRLSWQELIVMADSAGLVRRL